MLYLATDSLFQFFAVTQKSSAEAQNVAFFAASRALIGVAPTPSPRRLFFFGFISMFNGVAPTPSAFPVWIRWGIWVSPGAAWKSTSELSRVDGVNLHAIEQMRVWRPKLFPHRPTYYAMANLVIRGFIDEGNDNTESITNGVGFRNDISYGSIAPPVTYVLFAAFIILMKAATVFAMRGLKQAK